MDLVYAKIFFTIVVNC